MLQYATVVNYVTIHGKKKFFWGSGFNYVTSHFIFFWFLRRNTSDSLFFFQHTCNAFLVKYILLKSANIYTVRDKKHKLKIKRGPESLGVPGREPVRLLHFVIGMENG